MTEKELNLLQQKMSQTTNYLEFGSGRSTILAAQTANIKKITSVESDADFWKQQVCSDVCIQDAITSKRLCPLLINIGPSTKWGYPLDTSCKQNWPLYHSTAFEGNFAYDLVLVDGRFRIACILQTCLHCSSDTQLLVHDFFNRPYYFVVLPFFHIEHREDSMVVLILNKNRINKMKGLIYYRRLYITLLKSWKLSVKSLLNSLLYSTCDTFISD